MLLYRVLTALVGLPIALLVIWLGGWVFAGLVAALALVGMAEFYRLSRRLGAKPAVEIGYPVGLAFLFLAQARFAFGWPMGGSALALVALLVICCLARELFRPAAEPSLASLGATVSGCLYVALLLSFLVLLRGLAAAQPHPALLLGSWELGARLVLLVFIASWATDTAAYFFGHWFGRRKLCPAISPGKTVEGSIGGLVAAAIIGGAFGRAFGLPLVHALVLSGAMGLFGQVGDLAKSRLKREAGVKDFGSLFPGHGGVLDRFDSVLFNAPLAYYYLAILLRL